MARKLAQIDIKDCIIRLCDGRLASLSPASAPANSRLTFTDADYHRGARATADPISVAIVKSGLNTALSVSVTGKAITINVATDGAGVNTSTANQIITAYNLVTAATALASIANYTGSTGAGLTDAAVSANLINGPRLLALKVGDGTFQWTETMNRVYLDDRGKLDAVKDGDQEPVELNTDFAWEFLEAVTGSGTPTAEDIIEHRGEAAAWLTTSPNNCEPYCIDLEVEHDIPCATPLKEYTMFPMLRVEKLGHDPKMSKVTISGKCNVTMPLIYRL